MKTKICSKCKEEKDINMFYTGRPECKSCKLLRDKSYYDLNKETITNRHKEYWENNKEKCKDLQKTYRLNNVEKESNRRKLWLKSNKCRINDYRKKQRLEHPTYRLSENIRRRLNTFLKSNNVTKKNKTFDIVGCSPEFLKEYLEQKFTEGMSWKLMGQHIHIDHIIPLSSANTEEELYKLCHYTNLQPLWAFDNLSKGSKIL
jgi:hypothetical protein